MQVWCFGWLLLVVIQTREEKKGEEEKLGGGVKERSERENGRTRMWIRLNGEHTAANFNLDSADNQRADPEAIPGSATTISCQQPEVVCSYVLNYIKPTQSSQLKTLVSSSSCGAINSMLERPGIFFVTDHPGTRNTSVVNVSLTFSRWRPPEAFSFVDWAFESEGKSSCINE